MILCVFVLICCVLTMQDSIGGNCKAVIIANVSAAEEHAGHTAHTLAFARRAKNIVNTVSVLSFSGVTQCIAARQDGRAPPGVQTSATSCQVCKILAASLHFSCQQIKRRTPLQVRVDEDRAGENTSLRAQIS